MIHEWLIPNYRPEDPPEKKTPHAFPLLRYHVFPKPTSLRIKIKLSYLILSKTKFSFAVFFLKKMEIGRAHV